MNGAACTDHRILAHVDCGGGAGTRSRTVAIRCSMQISTEMDISHYDGAASEHDIGRAFDFGTTGDLVASVLGDYLADSCITYIIRKHKSLALFLYIHEDGFGLNTLAFR